MSLWNGLRRSEPLKRPDSGHTNSDALQELCVAAGCLPGVDGAAVMRIDGDRSAFVWGPDAAFPEVAQLEQALLAGPCRQSVDTGEAVALVAPMNSGESPRFAAAALSSGVGSLLVLPLVAAESCWGTLVLFSRAPIHPLTATMTAATALARFTGSHLALTAQREAERAALELVDNRFLHDQLTGLPTRGLMHELTFHALASARRRGSPVAVLFVDLDGFTAINDSRGHATGDGVLREVAQRLRAVVRDGDTVGRLSGDEFLIVCQDLPSADGEPTAVASSLANRVHAAITEPIESGGHTICVTASVGVAITTDRPSVADLIHEADLAMYEAKALGCGATIVHTGFSRTDGGRREDVEPRLFEALRRNEFEVYYQPIFDSDAVLVAVEALIRWNHPTDGVIPAAAFIDTAAATGLIVPLGHWVIRQAVAQLRRWRDTAPDTAPQLVWCNLGPLELVAPDLTDVITAALNESGLAPRDLGIEVLENHLDDPRLTESVTRLRAAGHPLALDDFGTGYSSLSRLVNLPVSHLKIDRSLVTDLPDDARSRTLVRAVLTIAHDLDVTVISEGIETSAQAGYLAAAGSHLFQGYHYGRPMPALRITDLLAASTPRPAGPPVTPASSPGKPPTRGRPADADMVGTDAPGTVGDGELFQQLPIAFLVVTPDLVIVDVNDAYTALLRHSREDLIGRRLFDAFPPTPDALDDQGRNPIQLSFERARDTGRPDVLPLQQYDVVDPATGAVEQRFWSLVNTPILARDGSTRLLVQRVEDVTDWARSGDPDGASDADGERTIATQAELFLPMQELRAARASEAAAIAALAESEARARAVLETAADGIITMSTTGVVQSMNPAAERMFDYPATDVVGRNISMLMPEPHATGHDSYLQRYRDTGERRVIGIGREVFGRRANGTTFPIEMAVSEVTLGNPFYTGVLRDISQRKQMEEQLAHQSTHDPLTGLANRTLLMDRLEHALARLARHPGLVAVFFVDLDRFKPVNDTYGHAAGDELLTRIAGRLRRVVRSEDLVARWGGDEFVVLCEELDQTWEADAVAERIDNAIAEPVLLPQAAVHPSASVGFVVDDGTRTADQLLAMADNAMYQRKTRRRSVPAPG